MRRLIELLEAFVFLDSPPGPIYLIEYFQGFAYEEYEYDEKQDSFDLTLTKDGEETTLSFPKEVSPDVLLASLQKYAREISET